MSLLISSHDHIHSLLDALGVVPHHFTSKPLQKLLQLAGNVIFLLANTNNTNTFLESFFSFVFSVLLFFIFWSETWDSGSTLVSCQSVALRVVFGVLMLTWMLVACNHSARRTTNQEENGGFCRRCRTSCQRAVCVVDSFLLFLFLVV